ncbi:pirin family protein [Jongsikchunia kroppenstedtii]|uniref:pirin family protein n=1 Tax=Jongsikchunia kroppenstedtii TaxID=1121721 RepID=UPI000362AA05|nr:pirin family protein [Jongsikchunia kroppenstedtii]
MSNLESRPDEIRCGSTAVAGPVQVVEPREVPLGGPRAMTVRRTLPTHDRTMVGAWCFADHYGGPGDRADGASMDLPPHPHTGLQTVTWLFAGTVEHRDSIGSVQAVRPGELNLMTSGGGICHSEVATSAEPLHGAQLWVALPESARHGARDFEHYVTQPVSLDGGELRVFIGELAGQQSPARTYTPLLGAELTIEPGAELALAVDTDFEHGVLVDLGVVELNGTRLGRADLGCVGVGRDSLTLKAVGTEPVRLLILGGEPLNEELVMWWNFVGRSHAEIEQFREDWQQQTERFGKVVGYVGEPRWLPAPVLPTVQMKPRRNPPLH